jgi:hypothetical protein
VRFDSFAPEKRRQLEDVLGASASKLIPELERFVRLYGNPQEYQHENKVFRAELARLQAQVVGTVAGLKGSSKYFRHIVAADVPETLTALEVLSSDLATMRSWFQKPTHRPGDRDWERLRRSVGFSMRAAGIKPTTAPPRGHHPRAAKLWRVLDIVSIEARHRHINSRDVEDVVRAIGPANGRQ